MTITYPEIKVHIKKLKILTYSIKSIENVLFFFFFLVGLKLCTNCFTNNLFYSDFIDNFRFEAHLINEHGALYDIDFLVQISQFKEKHNVLPNLVLAGTAGAEAGAVKPKVN